MKTSNYYYLLIGMCIMGLLFFVFKDSIFSPTGEVNPTAVTIFIGFIVLFVVGLIVALPIVYRRSLEQRGDKDLAHTLLANPQFREAILQSRTKGVPSKPTPGPAAHEKSEQTPRPKDPK